MRFRSLAFLAFSRFSRDNTKAPTIGGWSPGLRTLVGTRMLACGCLAGVYETWSNEHVTIIDTRSHGCTIATHVTNGIL